ncbi:MAG TPA: electron transfer flavoprotein subunit beta/FixA family protein [Acidimicrobiia bacterium]|nr:electron transfer flavoprotein subunit beta/FixA family protein [Acidimicrobiia bacterium]
MRIIVPIKQVPETSSVRMDEESGTMIREGVEAIVNPLDLYAIETALRLRGEHGGEVVAISMGPPGAVKALREAVAMGCDAAVLLSNRTFAGSDTWATGYTLSAGIRKLGDFDLVVCGERATDGDTGQVGPGIAAFLGLPVITYVGKIVGATDGVLRAHRLVENGHEDLEVDLPAVLTVVKEIGEARLPTLHGKRRARTLEVPTWGPDDLDVDVAQCGLKGSPTRVVKIFRPKVARECVKLTANDEASTEKAVDELLTFLRGKELL